MEVTMAVKYTLLWCSMSLSRKNLFFDFLLNSPQSTTISQYVLKRVVISELSITNTSQVKLFLNT